MSLQLLFNPFTNSLDYIDSGGNYFLSPVTTFSALPPNVADGAAAIVQDEDALYTYDANTTTWIFAGLIKSAVVGTSPNADGYSVAANNTLTLQPADATHPGVISSGNQTIGGDKTFTNKILATGAIDASGTTLTIGNTNATIINIGNPGVTVNVQGTTFYENVTQLQVTDPLITINKGGAAGSGANSGLEIEENGSITGYAETSSDRNSWSLKAPNTNGLATITPGASGITLDQSSHDPLTLTAVGSSPSANGASLSNQVLTLQPADGTHPGIITSGTQTIGGNKTLTGTIAASNLSGTNTGDQTITLTSDVSGSGTGSFATTVNSVGGSSATNIHSAELAANAATNANTASTIVKRDISGNFSAGTITASLTGNVSGSAASFTGNLVGDVTGTQGATVVSSVGGSSASSVHSAELAANAATSSNTNSTIVARDVSGNFSANVITASLTGIASGNTLASTGDIGQLNFTIPNNQSSPVSVTGLTFANATVRSARVQYSAFINATASLYEEGELALVQKGASWNIAQQYTGDTSGVVFSVTNAGQVQITTPNFTGYSTGKLDFRAFVTSV